MTPDLLLQVISVLMGQMNQGQKYEVLGRITALVMSGHAPVVAAAPERVGVYSPPPPAAVVPSGKVMIPKGFECVCDSCNIVIYKIRTDVLENMPKKDFVACFLPCNGAPELKMPLDAWADSGGNLAIDCPQCKGEKSLWIKGKGDLPYRDQPQGDNSGRADSSGGAGSV